MRRFLPVLFFLFILTPQLFSQKVGLTLSGGGAKGIAHIGMIKALEENGIPIDYITGTSMGAIVGGLYAIGYSPEEMMELIKSDDFLLWMSGQVEDEYTFYFLRDEPTPEFFNLKIGLRDSVSFDKRLFIPNSLMNARQINVVFTQLFAQGSAVAGYDFDNLMVPFRSVSSDINNRVPIVSKSGDLGDAVRASMSFPFVFKPIKLDSILVYDGGIFDNFPVGVMEEDFDPDFIIGSQVSSGRTVADERDIIGQLENMIMDKTEYKVPEDKGILLRFKLDNVNLLDFNKAEEIYKVGYDNTIAVIDSIKNGIPRRISEENVEIKRHLFKSKLPGLTFKRLILNGVNSAQKEYLQSQLFEEDEEFTYEEFKKAYFKLIADSKVSEIIPHAVYNENENVFELHLDVKVEENITLSFGGLVSSQNFNEVYIGATYNRLKRLSQSYTLDAQLGKSYNSVRLRSRTDLNHLSIPMALNTAIAFNSNRFYEGEKFFDDRESTAFVTQSDYYFKFFLATPFMTSGKVEFGAGIGKQIDEYYQPKDDMIQDRKFDKSSYDQGVLSFLVDRSTLNDKQYATKGNRKSALAQVVWTKERFYVSKVKTISYKNEHTFLQLEANYEKYHTLNTKILLGTSLDMMLSTRNFFQNYTATIIEAPAFTPTVHSKMIINEAFRANQFVAAGIKPIWKINNALHLRGEFYAFLPYKAIKRDKENKPYYGKEFNTVKWMAETNLVFRLSSLVISGYFNYYRYPVSDWNIGINIGYLIFTPKLLR